MAVFISEIGPRSNTATTETTDDDFIEVRVTAGEDVTGWTVEWYASAQADGTAAFRGTLDLSDTTYVTQSVDAVTGDTVYHINVTDYAGATDAQAIRNAGGFVSLTDGTDVQELIGYGSVAGAGTNVTLGSDTRDGNQSVDAGQTLTVDENAGSSIGNSDQDQSFQRDSDGGTWTTATKTPILCFCADSLIETDRGAVLVQDLRAGDMLLTEDGSFKPLKLVLSTTHTARDLARDARHRPVVITAGALGAGLPARDLRVSRQHRMLVTSKIAERMFDVSSVLVPAIKLTDLPGIYVDEAATEVTYYHLVMDAHEVIFSEGAPSESLYPGAEALKALPELARAELLALYPDAADQAPASAHLIPAGAKQKKLVARHKANGKPLIV